MNTTIIRIATEKESAIVQTIATASYNVAYIDILSRKQIDFMLKNLYSIEEILRLMQNGQDFYLILEENNTKGFLAVEEKEKGVLRIEKLYLLPVMKGKGYGKSLIDFAEKIARERNCAKLELNVNRGNNARYFYERQGFVITEEVDIPLDEFILDDYIMQKELV